MASVARASRQAAAKAALRLSARRRSAGPAAAARAELSRRITGALKEIRQDEEHRSSSGTRGGTAPGPVDLDPEFEGMRQDLDGASAGSGMPLGAALSEALGLGNPDGSHTYSWGNQEFVWRDGREFRLSFEKCEDIQAETPTPSSVKTWVKRVFADKVSLLLLLMFVIPDVLSYRCFCYLALCFCG